MVTQVEIARRLSLDVSSVNKILNRRQGPVFRKETVKKVFKAAHDLGYDFNKLKYVHRRRFPRREVSIAAEIAVIAKDGSVYDNGVATIKDISQCGAKVSDVALPQGSLPVEAFTITLRPMAEPLEALEIPGRIVRLYTNGSTSFGIDFQKLDSAAAKKLKRLVAV